MTSHEAIQSSRSELKYVVQEAQAATIRQYLGSKLRPDPNSRDGGYPVCSVYLDSADDMLLMQTEQGIRNRYKLRVRIYDDNDSSPAFLEIKSREGRAVKKQRAAVSRDVAVAILAGEKVSPAAAFSSPPLRASQRDWKAFQEFCRLRDLIGAVGTTYVMYHREAYVSPQNNDWRATFDRQLVASQYHLGSKLVVPQHSLPACENDTIVFELKFTNRFPIWMRELVGAFNLTAGPFPKYVTCRHRIRPNQASLAELARQMPRRNASTKPKGKATESLNSAEWS